jgi:uncharacterized protein (TIGR03118 family)
MNAMSGRTPFRRLALILPCLLLPAAILAPLRTARADAFTTLNLITDDQTANPALLTDGHLKNAWGISYPPNGPFWVSDNGSGLATLYRVDAATNVPTKLGLEVTIPDAGTVTGQAFNTGAAAGAFNGDNFLFVSEDGTVSGWRNALGTTAERFAVASPDNVYKGAAVATIGDHTYLYATNFHSGNIDVYKGDTGAPTLTGRFTDPNLPAGYAPFGIQRIGNTIYVTYALVDNPANPHDDVPGVGHGFVNAFDLQGNLIGRIGSMGTLNSPWGLAIAPASFGSFAGDLLVGNFGDGRINAFNLSTSMFVDQLRDSAGQPITIDGLWGLTVGNSDAGGIAGSSSKVYFSAGPDDESHGLFGVLAPVPEPTSLALLATGLAAALLVGRRRRDRR